MQSQRDLSEEEFTLLPNFTKALQCGCNEKFERRLISVQPSNLKFSLDQHEVNVTLWNKTRRPIDIQVDQPQSKIFRAQLDKGTVYGGNETTVKVQCSPGNQLMGFDCLRISVNRGEEVVFVPLQLFPGMAWFTLPKVIVMPVTSIGNEAELIVAMPQPPEPESFFVTIKTAVANGGEAISISPTSGTIGGPLGIREMVIKYAPKEYISITQIVELHIRNPDFGRVPHEIFIYARAVPGFESENIMKEVAIMNNFILKAEKAVVESERNIPEPKLKFSSHLQQETEGEENPEEDLLTPAGVVHFLIRKEKNQDKDLGPLGLTNAQEQKLYSKLEHQFREALNREQIRQKNILLQNTKSHIGEEPIHKRPEYKNKIIQERDEQRMVYEKAIGIRVDDQDVSEKNKVKLSNQRSIRHVKDGFPERAATSPDEIDKIEEEGRKLRRYQTLRKFIQAVYVIMVRYRVSKRIPKIRILIRDLRAGKYSRNK